MKPPIGQAWVDRGVIRERPPDPRDVVPCPVCGTNECRPLEHTVKRVWTEEDMDREAEANRPVTVTAEYREDWQPTPESRPSKRLKFAKGQTITRREAEAHKGLAWIEQDGPGVRAGIETKE